MCLTAVGGALLTSVPCLASFIVLSGNNPGLNQENVFVSGSSFGMNVQGTTNATNTVVEFESPTQFLAPRSMGQARIEARAVNDVDSDQVAIDDTIIVSLADSALSFTNLVFNAFNDGGMVGAGGTLTVVVNGFESNGDPVSSTFTQDSDGDPLTIGRGANFFSVVAFDGQRITSVEISPNSGSSYEDLRQVRIAGIIPEPASGLLLALGLGTCAVFRRR